MHERFLHSALPLHTVPVTQAYTTQCMGTALLLYNPHAHHSSLAHYTHALSYKLWMAARWPRSAPRSRAARSQCSASCSASTCSHRQSSRYPASYLQWALHRVDGERHLCISHVFATLYSMHWQGAMATTKDTAWQAQSNSKSACTASTRGSSIARSSAGCRGAHAVDATAQRHSKSAPALRPSSAAAAHAAPRVVAVRKHPCPPRCASPLLQIPPSRLHVQLPRQHAAALPLAARGHWGCHSLKTSPNRLR